MPIRSLGVGGPGAPFDASLTFLHKHNMITEVVHQSNEVNEMFFFLYFLAGIILAILYSLLAGGDLMNLIWIILATPSILIVWFMLAAFSGIFCVDRFDSTRFFFDWRAAFSRKHGPNFSTSFLPFFWIWTCYLFLPVTFRWSAVLMNWLGYESVGVWLYTHRYESWSLTITAALFLICIVEMLSYACELLKKIWVWCKSH